MITTITCGCEAPDVETLPVLVARPSGSCTVPGVKMLRCDNCRWAVEVNDTGITRNLNPSTPPISPKVSTAEALAHVTGSVGATYRVEKREADGTITILSEETYARPDDIVDDEDDEDECPGHESLNGADMGQSIYCDGTCIQIRRRA